MMRGPAIALLGLLFAASSAQAGNLVPATPGGAIFRVPVKSLVDLRFVRVIRQSQDLSCGAAALATLLKHFYGEEIGENDVLEGAAGIGDREKIARDGFSMLELKHFSEQRGYVSAGFRVADVNELSNLKIPVITLVNTRGYAHFVVLKGVIDGKVLIADPAFGNRSRPLEAFAGEWRNVVLAVVSEKLAGDAAFRTHTTVSARANELRSLLDFGLRPTTPSRGDF
jgi:predicted double-glycine peptidase